MSSIEWLARPGTRPETWNPVTGCRKVSEGCRNCYAETMAGRFWGERKFTDVRCHEDRLALPLSWRTPRTVFVNSMSDLFHDAVPDEFIDRVFAVMARAKAHTFIILTKRPERMLAYLAHGDVEVRIAEEEERLNWADDVADDVDYRDCSLDAWPLPNVILGVSVENQPTADQRIPLLLQTPAAVRGVSYEPALGPVDLDAVPVTVAPGFFGSPLKWHHRGRCHEMEGIAYPTLDWLIVGGESGPKARPCDVAWIRSAVRQCQAAGVPVFVKQLGARAVDGEFTSVELLDGMPGRQRPANQPLTEETARQILGSFAERTHHRPVVVRGKGNDPDEWPEDLRVREWPEVRL